MYLPVGVRVSVCLGECALVYLSGGVRDSVWIAVLV